MTITVVMVANDYNGENDDDDDNNKNNNNRNKLC
jgi:hypothetical protein